MAKGFKFPAPKGFAKGGMCKPKGMKGYAKGGPIRGTNIEASDLYEDNNDLASVEAQRNVPRDNKNRMRSENMPFGRAKKPENEMEGYAKGGKAVLSGKMKGARKFAKVKTAYKDGGEVETEQAASKSTKVKMSKGGVPMASGMGAGMAPSPLARVARAAAQMPSAGGVPKGRARAVPVAPRGPMIPPQGAPMASGMGAGMASSPLAGVARAVAQMPSAGGMGMKMGGKAKKR